MLVREEVSSVVCNMLSSGVQTRALCTTARVGAAHACIAVFCGVGAWLSRLRGTDPEKVLCGTHIICSYL